MADPKEDTPAPVGECRFRNAGGPQACSLDPWCGWHKRSASQCVLELREENARLNAENDRFRNELARTYAEYDICHRSRVHADAGTLRLEAELARLHKEIERGRTEESRALEERDHIRDLTARAAIEAVRARAADLDPTGLDAEWAEAMRCSDLIAELFPGNGHVAALTPEAKSDGE